ncbi:MAG: SRPBCC family protein [Bacteroidota bacterium]
MATLTQYIDGHSLANQHQINLKWAERYLSVISGVKVGLSGFKHLFSSPVTSLIKIGTGGYLLNRGITGHCGLYEKVGKTNTEPVKVAIRTSVMVGKPRMEVYDFWRKLDNLPLFMTHLKSVELLDNNQSRWALKLPADIAAISWDAQIMCDEPGELISWESIPGANLYTTGKVRFMDTPEHDTTLVHVAITYQPPAGVIGAWVAHLINPLFQKMVTDDVQNFKRYMDLSNIIEEEQNA